jgi:hypothetical protein
MDIWGRANDDRDTDANDCCKKEEAGTLVTSTYLCDKPWSLWIKGEQKSSNVKGNMYNFIHGPESANAYDVRELPDINDIDVTARHQAAKSSTIPK